LSSRLLDKYDRPTLPPVSSQYSIADVALTTTLERQISPPWLQIKGKEASKEKFENQNLAQHQKSGIWMKLKAPSICNMLKADLFNLDRLERLYRQAVYHQWIRPSQNQALNWVVAAVHARNCREKGKGDSVRIFAGIVRRGLWQVINQAEEDYARVVIKQKRGDVAYFGASLNESMRST
jgi:hypothetical protein